MKRASILSFGIGVLLVSSCSDDPTGAGGGNPYPEFTPEMVTPVYVTDVEDGFRTIQDHGLFIQAHVTSDFVYEVCWFCDHIQGIARFRDRNYFAVTASDHDYSKLAIAHIASLPEADLITSNENPPAGDKIVAVKYISPTLTHAGGLSTCGDILVVPVEGGGKSEVHFYYAPQHDITAIVDLSTRYTNAIVRRSDRAAGAVALTRFPTGSWQGQYLLAVLSHGSDGPLDFYLSRTTHVFDGFTDSSVVSWDLDDVKAGPGQDATFDGHQTINFIMQTDGALYLVGTNNNQASGLGEDWGDLYTVEFEDGDPTTYPTITKVDNKHFYCKAAHANFDGGASIYVTPDGKLSLYAIDRFTNYVDHEGQTIQILKIIEFPFPQDTSEPYWIKLYDDDNFRDRCLVLYGPNGHYLPEYHHVYVDGEWGFNDKISSVRWKLPMGVTYVLYEHRSYTGGSLRLRGNGRIREIPTKNGLSISLPRSEM